MLLYYDSSDIAIALMICEPSAIAALARLYRDNYVVLALRLYQHSGHRASTRPAPVDLASFSSRLKSLLHSRRLGWSVGTIPVIERYCAVGCGKGSKIV